MVRLRIRNTSGSKIYDVVIINSQLASMGKNAVFRYNGVALKSIYVYDGVWVVHFDNGIDPNTEVEIEVDSGTPNIDPSFAIYYDGFEEDKNYSKLNASYSIVDGIDGMSIQVTPTAANQDGYVYGDIGQTLNAVRIIGVIKHNGEWVSSIAVGLDTDNHYRFATKLADNGDSVIAIEKMVNGSYANITGDVKIGVNIDVYVVYGKIANGKLELKVYANGQVHTITATDSDIAQFTKWLLHVYDSSTRPAMFDNLVVLNYEEDPEIEPVTNIWFYDTSIVYEETGKPQNVTTTTAKKSRWWLWLLLGGGLLLLFTRKEKK